MSRKRQFNELCRKIISEFYMRGNNKPFSSKEFRLVIGKEYVTTPYKLLKRLNSKNIIKHIKRGYWRVTDEAFERFKKGEFND
ncbi:MAG: hypothetical protein R6U26_02005 [Candidatus Undinarchaeales archaeon]